MKILYISHYFPPEMGAPSARVSELSTQWAKREHDVTVLTGFPHHPHGKKRPEDRWVFTRRENKDGVDVVRVFVHAAPNRGFIRRVISYISFMISAIAIGFWRVKKPDVVIATSPQLFTGVAGLMLARLLRAPFVFEVRDLWPESITTVGAMNEGFAIRQLKRLASFLYRSADHIVTVGEGYKRSLVEKYPIDPQKISVVTNGVDLGFFRLVEEQRQTVRQQNGWKNRIVVTYIGTHGMAHGLEIMLKAADRLRDDTRFRFVLIGDGAEKENLQQLADERDLHNVTFLPSCDKKAVVGFYAASDVCLVPLRKAELFQEVLPSKIFEIMAMNRPMIMSVDGEARHVMESAGAGVFVEPENDLQLAQQLEYLSERASLRQQMGTAGREYVEQFYCRKRLARHYATLLNMVTTGKTRPVMEPWSLPVLGRFFTTFRRASSEKSNAPTT